MIDSDGYRPTAGIILTNMNGQLLWARRIRQDAWQFPQGGIRTEETPKQDAARQPPERALQVQQLCHQKALSGAILTERPAATRWSSPRTW